MYSNTFQMNALDSFDFSLRSMEGQNIDESNSAINISDVIEVIETDPAFGSMEPKKATLDGATGAYVKIIEQPASKALRFRYECEGRSAGSIPGVSSTPENKTFPTIQIVGYQGRAVVVVSCVTKDHPYKPHPHNLVGKEGCKKGVCTVELNNENMIATFANLGIQCVKKKDIEDALRMREEIRVDPFRTGFSHRGQPSSIDLNSVRLCFQAFLEGPHKGKFTIPLPAVVSEPIYDKKAMADLVICKLSHCSGSVAGGNEIILLCEKVAKEDITVRFYEEKDGQVIWEGYGDFTPTQVHKQVAISFRTPRYKTLEIDQPVKVLIQLRRPSDNATSEALPFQLTPLDSDPALLKRKRQKFNSENEVLMRQLQETEQMRLSHVTEHPGLSVKREPAETSPTSYMMFGGTMNVRNTAYASRTPSPLEYAVGAYPQGSYQAQAAVYQMVYSPASPLLSPGLPQQLLQPPQPEQVYSVVEDQVKLPTNNILNMDTHEYSIELNLERLNSKDLAELSMLDAGTLSANLSNNLNLNEEKHTGENMTDSFTRLTTNTLNELCALNDMYQASTSNQ